MIGEVGNEIMVSPAVAPADDFQTVEPFHGFGLGCLFHGFGVAIGDYLGPLLAQTFYVAGHIGGKGGTLWDDQPLVACAGCGLQHAVGEGCPQEITVADIVAVEACLVDVEDGADEAGGFAGHRMNVELHQPFLGACAPHVPHGQIHQKIIVGLSPLQEGLASGDVGHQRRCVAPDAVVGAHVH